MQAFIEEGLGTKLAYTIIYIIHRRSIIIRERYSTGEEILIQYNPSHKLG